MLQKKTSKISEGRHSGLHIEGPHNVEEGEIWVNMGNRKEMYVQSKMQETTYSLKDDNEKP